MSSLFQERDIMPEFRKLTGLSFNKGVVGEALCPLLFGLTSRRFAEVSSVEVLPAVATWGEARNRMPSSWEGAMAHNIVLPVKA
jgi:hypothetical protein